MEPLFTIAPSTASTVVGLTSGRILQISALERGVRLFSTVASTRAFFVIQPPFLHIVIANYMQKVKRTGMLTAYVLAYYMRNQASRPEYLGL